MRVTFLMRCTVCNEENYLTEKIKKYSRSVRTNEVLPEVSKTNITSRKN